MSTNMIPYMQRIEILVLAAGKSERFGRNKMLELIDGKEMLKRVVEEALRSGAEVTVVVGHEREKVEQILRGINVKLVFNEDYQSGMSSSIKAGIRESTADAIAILPGDMAFIQSDQIRAVIEEYKRTGAPIVVPTYHGRGGHPILFSSSLRGELLRITEEGRGLKEITARHQNEIARIELNTARILVDIDYQKDITLRRGEIQG